MKNDMTRDAAEIGDDVVYRSLELNREAIDVEARTVPASLSSEIEVDRWFGKEKLIHTKAAVILDRADGGLALLFNHNRDEPIGLVKDMKVKGGRLIGVLHFSNNAKAEEVWRDVSDGFLSDISIGYTPREWKESDDSDLVEVTRWEIFEASVVTVPADPTVGVNRSKSNEDIKVTKKVDGTPEPKEPGTTNVTDFVQARKLAVAEGREEGMRIESERRSGIDTLFIPERFQGASFSQLRSAAIEGTWSVEQTREALLDHVGTGVLPVGGVSPQSDTRSSVQDYNVTSVPGGDAMDKFVRGASYALSTRSMIETDKEIIHEARSNEFHSMSLLEMARTYLGLMNVNTSGMNREQIAKSAFVTRGALSHTTSDFANILENVAGKSMLLGFEEAPETWDKIARVGSLNDFKESSRPGMSVFDDLEEVKEDGEYKYGTLSDLKETIRLMTFGKLFRVSRQTLINDDLDAFTTVPRKLGSAANRKVGDLVYGVLIDNAALKEDGNALFHNSHNNIIATTGLVPSVDALNQIKVAMAKQKDPSKKAKSLGIRMTQAIVPIAYETGSKVLQSATDDPDSTGNRPSPNPFSNTFETVSDVRLDDASPTTWYAGSDPNVTDTIEVAFLDGNREPFIDSKDGWTNDGVEMKVRLDAAAAALGFRGLQRIDAS